MHFRRVTYNLSQYDNIQIRSVFAFKAIQLSTLSVLKGIRVAIGRIYYVFPALMGIEFCSIQRNNKAFQGVICCRLSLVYDSVCRLFG